MQSTPTVNPNRTSFYIQHGVGPACHTHSCVFLLPSSSVSHAAHHAPLLRRPTRLPLWSTTPVGHPSRAQAGRPYRVAPSRPLRSTALPILLLATLPALWLAPRSHASVNLDHRHRFGPPPPPPICLASASDLPHRHSSVAAVPHESTSPSAGDERRVRRVKPVGWREDVIASEGACGIWLVKESEY